MSSRAWLRPLVIVLVIAGWLAVGGVGGQTFGKLADVQENDAGAFLPSSAESTRAAELQAEFAPASAVPGIFVVDGVTGDEDLAAIEAFVDDVIAAPIAGDEQGRTVGDVLSPPASEQMPQVVPSEDGEAALVAFSIAADAVEESVGEGSLGELVAETIREVWADQDSELNGHLTGGLGVLADLLAAFAGIDGILLLVALSVVLVILLIVYRSPVLPLLVLSTAMIALTGAILGVYALADAEIITLNGQSQGIMFILVVGATTDYALLLVARYREELVRVESTYSALWRAWRRSLEPIAASAGTVILGLLVLLLSDLKSNAALGPAGAMGIAAALLAALTLLPALLLIGGRRARGVFWPALPRYQASEEHAGSDPSQATGFWPRVARSVDGHPRRTWIIAAGGLLVFAAFLPTFKASGLGEQDVFTARVDSVEGTEVLEQHFDAGATSPIRIFVPADQAEATIDAASGVDGVESAYVVTPSVAEGAPPGVVPDEQPLEIDGRVSVVAVTQVSSSSSEAADIVQGVRDAVHPLSEDALVGGQAAEQLDTRITTQRDTLIIIPTILAVIFIVLVMLLRSVLAPLLIVLANVLSYGATLGLSALLFNYVFGFPGSDPAVPLLGFVFLVALGVDYSIFLMSRAREESLTHGTRDGVRRALAVTGGVITSAGIVLAATFAALGVIPLIFLAQIAVIVGLGVLIDTFVVRSLLVPGLVSDIGRPVWWPWARRIPSDNTPS
ncbi:MMPL family transporter [Demequina muriae]|uniref:MMPL family transporter n=1 Tax=Demequina muriae TaxID=3051664 RepID=A0ABT8GJE2_9MICO|nr:MMPL family transporter [Demequina sp. EGI L300058]MDN4481535.1 MMPL family transporter [Demequina sp. EGI L300058]